MGRVTDDPWLDLVVGRGFPGHGAQGIVGSVRSTLLYQNGERANVVARLLGFVNAEHEALAAIASPFFLFLVDQVLAQSPYHPGQRDPVEYAQALLDLRYQGRVVMNSLEEILEAKPPLRRGRDRIRPYGRSYPPITANGRARWAILEVLEEYNSIILREIEEHRRKARQLRLPLELRGLPIVDIEGAAECDTGDYLRQGDEWDKKWEPDDDVPQCKRCGLLAHPGFHLLPDGKCIWCHVEEQGKDLYEWHKEIGRLR